jgi:hypothetical protein
MPGRTSSTPVSRRVAARLGPTPNPLAFRDSDRQATPDASVPEVASVGEIIKVVGSRAVGEVVGIGFGAARAFDDLSPSVLAMSCFVAVGLLIQSAAQAIISSEFSALCGAG